MDYSRLTALLIEAVKQQQQQVRKQQIQIRLQETLIRQQANRINRGMETRPETLEVAKYVLVFTTKDSLSPTEVLSRYIKGDSFIIDYPLRANASGHAFVI